MTINYKGCTKDYPYRVAEINYREEEVELFNRLVFFLERISWEVESVTDGYALIQVDNFEQYKELVQDYKARKRVVKNCMKFGF